MSRQYFLTIVIFAVLGVLFIQCSTRTGNQDEWDKKNVRDFEADDARVKRALKSAQDSLIIFVANFKKYYGQADARFFIKNKFSDGENVEHMWSMPFEIRGTAFRAVLDNAPGKLENYSLGDTVEIDFRKIEDFVMISRDTLIFGDYLKKALQNDPSADK